MSNTRIQHIRSSVPGRIPSVSQLANGEIAVNTHDGKLFFKKDANGSLSIVEIGPDTAQNVLYVSKSGNNSSDGKSLTSAFLTLEAALAVATTGTTIYLKSGSYTENCPLEVPAGVSIVGDNARTTSLKAAVSTNDILHVRNSCYITGITFRDHVSPAAAVAFPDSGAGLITSSPYVYNCSSITTTGTGMRIDGSKATGGRSMITANFTQLNSGGIGVHVLNKGFAQLVSIFTLFCDIGVLCESGGQCDMGNSNSSFGNYGLKAIGVSTALDSGTVSATVGKGFSVITVTGLSSRPRYGDAILFSSHNKYYTVIEATALSSGSSIVTIDEGLDQEVLASNTVTFHKRSSILATGHTFEYVGSGTNAATALPQVGGFPIQENEVIEDSDGGGKVFFTSSDQLGNFRVGQDLIFNRASGTITGETFDRSLFAVMTPYILALEG